MFDFIFKLTNPSFYKYVEWLTFVICILYSHLPPIAKIVCSSNKGVDFLPRIVFLTRNDYPAFIPQLPKHSTISATFVSNVLQIFCLKLHAYLFHSYKLNTLLRYPTLYIHLNHFPFIYIADSIHWTVEHILYIMLQHSNTSANNKTNQNTFVQYPYEMKPTSLFTRAEQTRTVC